MCGLAGILDTSGHSPPSRLLSRFAALLAHRGPDGEGVAIDGPVGLAHRRLSILDLSEAAHQPMWDEAGRACLVFNGEIYNFRELRQELEKAGWSFRSHGDTEVLLKACLHYGVPQAIERVNGMFALVLWDRSTRRLWLARDRMGIKPLFYSIYGGQVLFGSEIKPILQCRPAAPDLITLLDVLAGEPPHWGSATLFEGVMAVEPGEWLCFEERGKLTRGWYFRLLDQLDPDLYAEAEACPAEVLVKTLHGLLQRSVAMHMVSDVPVAVLASGGLDSNIIAALAKPVNPNVDLYHADVVGPLSEAFAAEELARHLCLRLRAARVHPHHYAQDLARVAYYNECPSGYHPNDVPFHLVSRLAAEDGVKVLLTGEGADELFHGYGGMVLAVGRRSLQHAGERARTVLERLPCGRQLLNLLPHPDGVPGDLLCRGHRQALRQEALDACGFIRSAEDREVAVDGLVWSAAHLQSLLHRNDRMGMMEGLESRIPYLENELVRFAVNLPRRFKLARHPLTPGRRHPMRENKWLLRRVGSQLLPEALYTRKKIGFTTAPWEHVSLRPEFFRDGFLLHILGMSYEIWRHMWRTSSEEFQWSAFTTELWGRIFFLGKTPDAVAEELVTTQNRQLTT